MILSHGSNLRAPVSEISSDAVAAAGDSTLRKLKGNMSYRVFRQTGGVISKAATRLGIPRTTLNALMTKLGVSRKELQESARAFG